MECSKCAQEVLLVAAAEDVSCQDPKGRPVQMPEHYHWRDGSVGKVFAMQA